MKGDSILAVAPSFSSYSSTKFAEIATQVSKEFSHQREELGLEPIQESEEAHVDPPQHEQHNSHIEEKEQEEEEEFEFAVFSRDSSISQASAEEIFSNGQIKPIYPVFNRDLLFSGGEDDFMKLKNGATIRLPLKNLFIEERDPSYSSSSSSHSQADELEALPEGTYCVWTPKPAPEKCKKSNSTGSSKRWRLSNLLNRSNSDGKDAYVFLTPSSSKSKTNADRKSESSNNKAGKAKPKASAHEVHYVRNRALKESDRRRSYLPYRQDLVGLFANSHSLNRALRPF